MYKYLFSCCLLLTALFTKAQQHPLTFFTSSEAAEVKKHISQYPLLKNSFAEVKKEVDLWIGKDIDVPFPKDPAGGYTHDKHKFNYMLMFNSGVLYNLTGEVKYAILVKQVMLKYADLNPTLKNHPQATSSSPGRIFWQALNDANWLVYAGMAYDLTYNSYTASERKKIEEGAFKPEVDFFTKEMPDWFDLIHNHAVWACAGVGIVGVATNNKDYIDMALYGTKKDGKSGFIALMNGLFSPDGYYTEGPYYVRYAILPYYVFANALQNARPSLNIFEHRNRILQKALQGGLQMTNTDGTFFALNDALKEKDYTSNELVTALSIAWKVYGKDPGMLLVAKKQNRVLLNKGGMGIAAAISNPINIPTYFPYKTIEFTDGKDGDAGGVSVLRNGNGNNLSTLIFKYTSHGLSHGHYDKLTYNLYDKGNEILRDYGAVRFIGVEQKYGGRYLPETKSYAMQTIAHNTLVADEASHFGAKESVAENFHSNKLYSNTSNKNMQVVIAAETNAYKNIGMKRFVYMLQLPDGKKLLADIFTVAAADTHQYDMPFQYNGHLISTNVPYKSNTSMQTALGTKNGYQHLFNEAAGEMQDTTVQLTFLNDRTYYSISSLLQGPGKIFFARAGANDPNFNLRHEPSMIIRKNAANAVFVNITEIHGNFDPILEFSTGAYASVKKIQLLQQDDTYTVAQIQINDQVLIIAQSNTNMSNTATHKTSGYNWTGPVAVFYQGKPLP